MILYINNEHCSSVEQLKGYFTEALTPDSDIYADLLDYGRYGDIAVWLREMGELEQATRVEAISGDLSDSAFFAQLKAVVTGTEVKDAESLKPTFDKCFAYEGVKCDIKENEAKVFVCLKVLMCVNEEYELCVSSNWGTRGAMVNPYSYSEGKTATVDFTLRKRPGKEIGQITVKAEGKELSCKKIQKAGSNEEIKVGNVEFKMIHVEGGTFTMGEGSDAHQVTLSSYYIGETPVTQEQWKSVMGSNPSYFNGDKRPVETVSWINCQDFLKKLNAKTGKKFRLLTEAEWEFAARGGNKSKHTPYRGSNNLDEVAWYSGNSRSETHPVKQKKPNELGIYDMSGNVWEWCQDWFTITRKAHRLIQQVLRVAPTACAVVAAGAWMPGSVTRRGVATATLTTGTTALASVLPSPSNNLFIVGIPLILKSFQEKMSFLKIIQ